MSGHLTKGRRHECTAGCLRDECGNVRGRELVGEPLPSSSEPDRVSVADLDLHCLEHHRAQPGERCRVRADGAPNRDLHAPDSSMRLCPGGPRGHCAKWHRGQAMHGLAVMTIAPFEPGSLTLRGGLLPTSHPRELIHPHPPPMLRRWFQAQPWTRRILPAHSASRSANFWILPVDVFGSSSRKSTLRGAL